MFITLTVVMVVLAVLSFLFLKYADNYRASFFIPAALIGILSGAISFIVAVFISVAAWGWYSAEYKAKIINQEYNTSYTQEEIFYASDVIEIIRKVQRNRHEVSVNINQEEKK